MESIGAATGRAIPPGVLQRVRPRAEWVPWALAAAIAIGAGLRFATLGLQGYHHDEAWTAGVILHRNLFTTIGKVTSTESTPYLYYVLAWAWTKVFGSVEWGLRSLSALIGVATIPVAYLIGRRIAGGATGLAAAALVAVNPALIWYSQEGRSYALLVLFTALAFYFFLRARDGYARRDLVWWAGSSVLALLTHYFAAMPAAIEALFLVAGAGRRRRPTLYAVGSVAATGLALLPLAAHQASAGHADWITRIGLGVRLKEVAVTFTSGETGRFIDQPLHSRYAWVPLALLALALVLVARRASRAERRNASIALVVAAGTLVLALAAVALGHDFLLARNLLPALIPLLVAAAVGLACRSAGRLGLAVGAALVAYWLAFAIYVDLRPRLQRPDWRDIATAIGAPAGPREIVTSGQGTVPILYYTKPRPVQLHDPPTPLPVREVDVLSIGLPRQTTTTGLPVPFRYAGHLTRHTVTVTRYRAPRPVPVPWSELLAHYTGFQSRDVLAQGRGARQASKASN